MTGQEWWDKAEAHVRKNEPLRALECLDHALSECRRSRDPDSTVKVLQFRWCIRCDHLNDSRGAMSEAEAILDLDPALGHFLLGQNEVGLEDWNAAIREFSASSAGRPYNLPALIHRASAYRLAGMRAEAINDDKEVLRLAQNQELALETLRWGFGRPSSATPDEVLTTYLKAVIEDVTKALMDMEDGRA